MAEVWPGRAYPLGATYDGAGTNFSLFSEIADRIELCLFDDGEESRYEIVEVDAHCWHAYLPGIVPGQRYGWRVHGPWDPANGHRCNPAKLLVDPYAKAVAGSVDWDESCFSHRFDDPLAPNEADSAPHVPKAVVVSPYFDWGNDHAPGIALEDTIIYEVHVKGFTQTLPGVPEELRGTYAGLAHPAAVKHLQKLGVTSVELLPTHQFVHDHWLMEKGLQNYWGYNSIGFLAPHNGYAAWGDTGAQVQEFRHMVKALHDAGLEVILDVVYNHTAEGDHEGPTLSFKGIDNAAYYRLEEGDLARYRDYTGTGNSMNMRHPHVLQLIMDSLRYWVTEMHVDGFRFDLAATLARELHEVDRLSAFFDLIQQDPVVSRVKLIAEPWDLGEGGYQVGNFPPLWSEWNGKFRDTVRDYWLQQHTAALRDFGYRFTGSSDLYEASSRRPSASVNFVTAHDGFTLADLVRYDRKHNEANGEDDRDGTDDNRSWNHGVEGPTHNVAIETMRRRQQKNLLVTLLCSQGVPMLLGGDELGRHQQGNNNAYCQDNQISWYDWAETDVELLSFTRRLIALRRDHPVFRRRRWFQGRSIHGTDARDISWLRTDGSPMTHDDWIDADAAAIGIFLNGDAMPSVDRRGEPIVDDSFLLLFNPTPDDLDWQLPGSPIGERWELELSSDEELAPGTVIRDDLEVTGRSATVLRRLD
ncbi:MAG: glycogen debranching protein GlgX [Acidimicrobiales bacterium]